MKKIKNVLLVAMFFAAATVLGQIQIKGKIVDEMGEPLPGASLLLKNSTLGTETDFDGNFVFKAKGTPGVLVVSFIGYVNKELTYTKSKTNLGTIQLAPSNVLNEIVVTATSFAIDRKTPVAVSTIKATDIERKLGTQEFPEILKSTPGVYATKSGGGFGDGRINLRGFNSVNVAVMINGVPVNDMENGRVFWSNWAGLGDVTSALQVQRGLGASKVAVPSIGGTMNILTKGADSEKGGSIRADTGNNGYQKYGLTLSTGKMDNGFAATVSVAKISGEGYVDGTPFNGFNYFVNLTKIINEKHEIGITSFGTPQTHGARRTQSTIASYRNSESGIKYNPDWGYKNGQITNLRTNSYHKNQTSLNHYWNISDKSSLSTALYLSLGNGGGVRASGANQGLFDITRFGNSDQPIDFDKVVDINKARAVKGESSEAILAKDNNNHVWYGVLSTFKTKISDNINFVGGLDLREYKGLHFREVEDLLGGKYYADVDSDTGIDNNLNNTLPVERRVGDKVRFNNDGLVGWQGFFTQVEYSGDYLDMFVSSAVSNTSYTRIDYFNYTDNDANQESDTYNFIGHSIKGGINYRIDSKHNVFGNIGYFEKAPLFRAVFTAFDNEIENINADAENEKVFSLELGYGLRSEKFAANLNVYRTQWNDRSLSQSISRSNGERTTANLLGVNALHQGVEFDFTWKPTDKFNLTGMASLGDWRWDNDLVDVELFDENQVKLGTADLLLKDLKIADAAQTTFALGALYKFMDKTSVTLDYNFYADLYADFNFEDFVNVTEEGDVKKPSRRLEKTWQLPSYHTFDASLRHGFDFGGFDTTVTLRVNNILDAEYVSDAIDGTTQTAEDALVWFGAGRTFSLGAKIKF